LLGGGGGQFSNQQKKFLKTFVFH